MSTHHATDDATHRTQPTPMYADAADAAGDDGDARDQLPERSTNDRGVPFVLRQVSGETSSPAAVAGMFRRTRLRGQTVVDLVRVELPRHDVRDGRLPARERVERDDSRDTPDGCAKPHAPDSGRQTTLTDAWEVAGHDGGDGA